MLERPSQEDSRGPQGHLGTPSDAETSLGTAGKICSTRPFSPILSPSQGLLSGPKSFSHGQDPQQKFISLTWGLESRPTNWTSHSECAQYAAQVILIRDDKDAIAHRARFRNSARVGISIWNVEPLPTVDSTQMRPPCISTICLAIASPTPVPPLALVRELST